MATDQPRPTKYSGLAVRPSANGSLGTLGSWACPSCGEPNVGSDPSVGCAACGSGAQRAFQASTPQPEYRDGAPLSKEQQMAFVPPIRRPQAGQQGQQRVILPNTQKLGSTPSQPALIDYDRIQRGVSEELDRALIAFRTLMAVHSLETLLDDERWRRAVATGLVVVREALEQDQGDPQLFPAPAELQQLADALMDVENAAPAPASTPSDPATIYEEPAQ